MRLIFLCIIITFGLRGAAQPALSTSMPVPPLQWLNITQSTKGSPPPPLKDSVIGYDDNTRTLIIFGGEAQTGLPQQDTYLLNLDSLTWSRPETKVPAQSSEPPARSRALGSGDFAANSRRDFVVFGGQGYNNQPLGDVWAYNFLNQFWANVPTQPSGIPQPRWGAIGGIDQTIIPGSSNNVNTTLYIAGGSDGFHTFPSSELWQLVITGTLASDVIGIQGQWSDISLTNTLAGKSEAGGALIPKHLTRGARIVISGGCGSNVTSLDAKSACADPATYVLTVGGSSISPVQCPAPRVGPVIVPNLSPASPSFASQSLMILGTFDSSIWTDEGGLDNGEVAVLDVDAGAWARIIPAGDPSSAAGQFPVPRQGAAAFSFPSALVGSARQGASDTIVFGGQNSNGQYLNDLWILRAYNASISNSGDHWAGFGNGNLQSGVSASGAGVTVKYLTSCAQPQSGKTTQPASSTSVGPSHTGSPLPTTAFNVSIAHRVLSPVSIALVLVATFVARLSSTERAFVQNRNFILVFFTIFVSVAAYAIGIAGFATSLTSTTSFNPNLHRRNDPRTETFLKTRHARAGFILFLCLYGLVPTLALCLWLARLKKSRNFVKSQTNELARQDSHEIDGTPGEKDIQRPASPVRSTTEEHSAPPSFLRQRTQSGLLPVWRGQLGKEPSEPAPVPARSFEVVNRPRRASGGMLLYPPRDLSQRRTEVARSLSDMSWLERRRSVNAVGELDYALSQLPHTTPRSVSPPATSRPPTVTMSNRPFVRTPPPLSVVGLNGWNIALHTLFHLFLLANCILVLIALFLRAPIATFIMFLIWTVAFYVGIFILAWNGEPHTSVLSRVITQLRTPIPLVPPTSPVVESAVDDRSTNLHSPLPGSSPYIYHQPPWRRAVSPEEEIVTRTSHGGRYTAEADDDPEEDMDDDEGQRHMEEELMRRDVNIVTVPRRKLWITNPS